jgi:hypothetical protein
MNRILPKEYLVKREKHKSSETVRINITLRGEPAKWLLTWKKRGFVNSNRDAVVQSFRLYYDIIRKSDLENAQLEKRREY